MTGNGWSFPIRFASATISLPSDSTGAGRAAGLPADSVGLEAWTGPDRSTEQNAVWAWGAAAGEAVFATTRPLGTREGLTIRLDLPAALALAAVNVLFFHLLERPTLKGRGVLDRLEGVRRFLPHAIALGVENRWSQRFQDVLIPTDGTGAGRFHW